MNFSVVPSDKFKKEAKRLIKKYPSLKQELAELGKVLETDPDIGVPLGNSTFKIRISITSKNKGKSGGGRVITYVVTENREIYLLTIYDKSEFANVDVRILRTIISSLDIR